MKKASESPKLSTDTRLPDLQQPFCPYRQLHLLEWIQERSNEEQEEFSFGEQEEGYGVNMYRNIQEGKVITQGSEEGNQIPQLHFIEEKLEAMPHQMDAHTVYIYIFYIVYK